MDTDNEVVLITEGQVEPNGDVWSREAVQAMDGLEVATVLPEVKKHIRVRERADGRLEGVVQNVPTNVREIRDRSIAEGDRSIARG